MSFSGEGGRIAIMQPYLFPYLGYFQLLYHVDAFWILDTVKFIKGGWMNRNALWVANSRSTFSLPLKRDSSSLAISKRQYSPSCVESLSKLKQTVGESYSTAAYCDAVCEILSNVQNECRRADDEIDFTDITEFALRKCASHIGVTTPIERISSLRLDSALSGQQRIIAACQKIGAREYLNMAGGRDLYSVPDFEAEGVKLLFLQQDLVPYDQGRQSFEPGLSILDAIAHVAPEEFEPLVSAGSLN